jgi:hypothetical protein
VIFTGRSAIAHDSARGAGCNIAWVSWMYQCEKIINTINDATNTHHAIETPNIQASRVIEATPN